MGAFIYFVLVATGLFVAYKKAMVSPFSAYLLMAVGGLGTGLFLLSQIGKCYRPILAIHRLPLRHGASTGNTADGRLLFPW